MVTLASVEVVFLGAMPSGAWSLVGQSDWASMHGTRQPRGDRGSEDTDPKRLWRADATDLEGREQD